MKTVKALTLIYLVLIVISCQKLFDSDISGQTVVLKSPIDSLYSENYLQTFWWEEVEGAETYNLQIVSPRFDSVIRLVLDTNLSTNQFTYTLYPNNFQWRVKGYNSSYETLYTTASFTIDSTDLPTTPELIGSTGNGITNEDTITFEWNNANFADSYRITIRNMNTGTLHGSVSWPSTSITIPDALHSITAIPEGKFTWTVKSSNANGDSEEASPLEILVDRTNPADPIPQLPKQMDTIGDFYLQWYREIDSGTDKFDSILIYKDSLKFQLIRDLTRDTTNYTELGLGDNWYHYQVKTMDKAGNESNWSERRMFYYQDGYGDEEK